jgi:predicted unusual protein kinase regulating ubiquinone biosynthesis (AarF/ABC1/UbiB family)
MARNLESGRTARLVAEQEQIVARLKWELDLAKEALVARKKAHREAVQNPENWV